MARIDRDSLEYLSVRIASDTDLSGATVEIAIVDQGVRPETGDFTAVDEWDGADAKILVGPPSNTLAPGTYDVWVRITDAPEAPVLRASRSLTIT